MKITKKLILKRLFQGLIVITTTILMYSGLICFVIYKRDLDKEIINHHLEEHLQECDLHNIEKDGVIYTIEIKKLKVKKSD